MNYLNYSKVKLPSLGSGVIRLRMRLGLNPSMLNNLFLAISTSKMLTIIASISEAKSLSWSPKSLFKFLEFWCVSEASLLILNSYRVVKVTLLVSLEVSLTILDTIVGLPIEILLSGFVWCSSSLASLILWLSMVS